MTVCRSPLFIRHSGNFDLYLTIGDQVKKKKMAYQILFLKEISRLVDVWQLVGGVHKSFKTFFFFFSCTNISHCWQPWKACTAFCIIMIKTVLVRLLVQGGRTSSNVKLGFRNEQQQICTYSYLAQWNLLRSFRESLRASKASWLTGEKKQIKKKQPKDLLLLL